MDFLLQQVCKYLQPTSKAVLIKRIEGRKEKIRKGRREGG